MKLKLPENSVFVDMNLDECSQHDIKVTTVMDGIKAAISPNTNVIYAKGCDNFGNDVSGIEDAVNAGQQADAVVLVLGDLSGLTPACTTGETRDSSDLKLPGVQEELAKAVLEAGKPVAVILITGRPYALAQLAESANAILEAWLPGEEGGAAVADILFGDFNPGGKLPITFPRSAGQIPVYYSHKPSGMKSHWYVDYVSEKATPLYPFGHGLSYTAFEYSGLSIGQKKVTVDEVVDVELKIRNIGEVPGEEVIQLYIRDIFASTPRPVKELKGYQRIALNPDEAKTVTFHLPVNQLAFHDTDLCLVVEPGTMEVMIGSSSEDIRLSDTFEIAGNSKMIVKDRVFVCPVDVK